MPDATVDQQVIITRVFDAPRARVFKAWTDPEDVAAWYGPEHSDTPRELIRIDLRVGGRYELTMVRRDNGAKFALGYEIIELIEPELLVESGLRHSGGEAKWAYDGFRLPLVAERGSRTTRLWGLVRPAASATSVRIEYLNRGTSRWRTLKRDRTDSRGYWATTTSYRSGRSYRVRWEQFAGPPTRAYRR